MKLIGKPQPFRPGPLHILRYHKIGLGLETGTKIYLAALPPNPSNGRINEVLLTTIAPQEWGHLYRLSMSLNEKHGVVSEVLRVLRDCKVNINIMESLTTESTKCHEVLAILTLHNMTPTDFSELLAQELKEHLYGGTIPQVQPLSRLRDAYARRKEERYEDEVTTTIERELAPIKLDEWRSLFHVAGDLDIEGYSRVVMFSDTEEKYVSLFFPDINECLLRVTVKHRDIPGALSSFTDQLKQMGVNIVNSYSRIQKSGESAEWRATLDVTEVDSCWKLVEVIKTQCEAFQDFLSLEVYSHPGTDRSRSLTPLFNHELAIRDPNMFHGRLDDLRSVSLNPKHYLISGYYKTGKSSFLKRAASEMEAAGVRLPILVDSQGVLPGDLLRTTIRHIWNKIANRLQLDIPPDTLRAFIPTNMGRSSIVALPPGEPHRIDASQSIADSIHKYHAAFVTLGMLADKIGLEGISVFVDEAQLLLHSVGSEGDALRATWAHLNESIDCKLLQWVVADSAHWQSGDRGAARITTKMSTIILRQLPDDDARKLVEVPFGELGIHPASTQVTQHMLSICGNQPSYIQALCGNLVKHISNLPKMIDIITEEMVEGAIKDTADSLHDHMREMIDDLSRVLNESSLEQLLSSDTPISISRESLIPQNEHGGSLRLSLEAVPGLTIVIHEGQSKIAATELFRFWAKRRGLSTRRR